jgi:hypothetical protein
MKIEWYINIFCQESNLKLYGFRNSPIAQEDIKDFQGFVPLCISLAIIRLSIPLKTRSQNNPGQGPILGLFRMPIKGGIRETRTPDR